MMCGQNQLHQELVHFLVSFYSWSMNWTKCPSCQFDYHNSELRDFLSWCTLQWAPWGYITCNLVGPTLNKLQLKCSMAIQIAVHALNVHSDKKNVYSLRRVPSYRVAKANTYWMTEDYKTCISVNQHTIHASITSVIPVYSQGKRKKAHWLS